MTATIVSVSLALLLVLAARTFAPDRAGIYHCPPWMPVRAYIRVLVALRPPARGEEEEAEEEA